MDENIESTKSVDPSTADRILNFIVHKFFTFFQRSWSTEERKEVRKRLKAWNSAYAIEVMNKFMKNEPVNEESAKDGIKVFLELLEHHSADIARAYQQSPKDWKFLDDYK